MDVNNNQKYFDLIICDFDTPLFQAAKFVQEDYIKVTSKNTGKSWEWNEFRLKTEFQGTNRKGDVGGWVGAVNDFLGTEFKREDFEIEHLTRLRKDIDDHLGEAERQFSYAVAEVKKLGLARDYKLCIGGEGNFRYDIATILPYKGERKAKPILFQQLKDKVISQYKKNILIADNCEADDLLGIFGTENQAAFRKTGKYKYVLGYIDKDIKQIWGPTIFLNKKEDGVIFITPFEAAYHFAFQCLKGDKQVDNIQGLNSVPDVIREKYGIRKGNGCGDVAAHKILSGCVEIKDLFERVVECYKECYQEEYKFYLKENAQLLWMQRKKGQCFDIFKDLLDKFGVEY